MYYFFVILKKFLNYLKSPTVNALMILNSISFFNFLLKIQPKMAYRTKVVTCYKTQIHLNQLTLFKA